MYAGSLVANGKGATGAVRDGRMEITLPAGKVFQLQYSTDLEEWNTIANEVRGRWIESDSVRMALDQGYYRVTEIPRWQPPIGIPVPEFGIDEIAPARPDPWDQAATGFIYVDQDHPNATDDHNAHGWPDRPRETIPLDLTAGTVVEINGRYEWGHSSPRLIRAAGTEANPIFIRGRSEDAKASITRPWEITDSRYLVLEHLHFQDEDGDLTDGDTGSLTLVAPNDHIAVRHCEVSGNLSDGGIGIASFADEAFNEQMLVWDNHIHHNGDVLADFDQDVLGIGVGNLARQIWLVDNEINHCSGDGIQINARVSWESGIGDSHHIYIGRNELHHNKQSGAWSKQAADVIFSQNVVYGHRPSNSSTGAGLGFQYGPERMWFLCNHIYDNTEGIAAGSNSGEPGQEQYFIGNVIHDIHHSDVDVRGELLDPYNADTPWSSAAIRLSGGWNRTIVNNTIYDVDAGINVPGPLGSCVILNNIFGSLTPNRGTHIFFEQSDLGNSSIANHNLYAGTAAIRWGNNTVVNLQTLRSQSGQGGQSIEGDVGWADAAKGDFSLQPSSPAVDAGTLAAAYARFQELYGIDIAFDIQQCARPQGTGWDMGAYERE